jgi:2-polyprenyl-3-methyl-5-hydroxy-6-metoxy-1,4-benzoquinol methylase
VILDRGWTLSVVEVSEYAAETARQKWGLDVTVSRIEDIEYPAGYFDFIKLGHVIEHLADPSAVLRKLNTLLRDDGLILIDTDNASGLRTRIEISIRRLLGERLAAYLVRKLTGKNLRKRYGRLTPPIHLYTFSPRSLRLLLERTGFTVVKLIEPAWGDPTWFPITSTNDLTLVERVFLLVDTIGAKLLDHGEVLVVFARKKSQAIAI